MTRKKALPPSLIGFLVIAAVFALLAVLPEWFQKRRFLYGPSSEAPGAPSNVFPLATELAVILPEGVKKRVPLSEYAAANPRGVLINFWATWCPPCLEELPGLEFLNRQLRAKPKELPSLITVSVDESPADVFNLYKTLDFKPSLVVLYDRDGELSRKVGTAKFPETYWVSPQGKILHKWVGPQNWLSEDVIKRLANRS